METYKFDSYFQGNKVEVTIDERGKITHAKYIGGFTVPPHEYGLMEELYSRRIASVLDEVDQEAREYNAHVNYISAAWRNQ